MLFHRTVTFNGAAQNVKVAAGLTDADDVALASFSVQEDAANAAVCFVGGSNLTSAIYLWRLPVGASGIGPIIIDPMRPVKPSEVWVLGTAGQKIHIGGVPV